MAEESGTKLPQSKAASVVTVEHRVSTAGGGSGGGLGGTSRAARSALVFGMTPMIAALAMYAVGSTGAWAGLLPWGLGLSDEVDRLESQVDRLEGLVTNLTEQVDRFAEQNAILAENNAEFRKQNAMLNASNVVYEEQNDRLNASVAELERQNDILEENNADYAALNAQLNETNQNLSDEVDTLEVITQGLNATVVELDEVNQNLTVQVDRLEVANGNLTVQVDELETANANLTATVDELEQQVKNLEEILEFIKEYADEIQESVESIAAFLADQIEIYRQLIMVRLELTYQQSTIGWVCGYDLTFRGQPFTDDPNSPMGAAYYPLAVVSDDGADDGYVEEEVLTELCLNNTDFELYLSNLTDSEINPPVNVTSNELQVGVSRYTGFALEWYFPSTSAGPGLDSADWANASYDCKNLDIEQRFFWGPTPAQSSV